jgi:2-polyprenyl-3-methyl-5-hydroxy-6-metoxy-1,4-benzoquinol methylase
MKCPVCDIFSNSVDEISNACVLGPVYVCKECDLNYLSYYRDSDYVESLYHDNKIVYKNNISHLPDAHRLKYDDNVSRVEWVSCCSSPEKTLLEIGCGDGSFLQAIKHKFRSVSGVELTAEHRDKVEGLGIACSSQLSDDLIRSADVICMFAVLEHIPKLTEFVDRLRRIGKDGLELFIEVPHKNNVLFSQVSLPAFKRHYYRPEHLYYFSQNALERLFINSGFDSSVQTVQQASLTNLFHWLYREEKQPSANHMTSVTLPLPHLSELIINVLDKADDYYREMLQGLGLGDLLRAHLKNRK